MGAEINTYTVLGHRVVNYNIPYNKPHPSYSWAHTANFVTATTYGQGIPERFKMELHEAGFQPRDVEGGLGC